MGRNKHTRQEPRRDEPSHLTPWNPFPEFGGTLEDLRRDLMDPFKGFFAQMRPSALPGFEDFRAPRVNIEDRGADYQVTAELPGIPKDKVDVTVTEDHVEIRAETTEEKEEKRKNFYHREIGRQAFYRRLPLPSDADPQAVDATMEDGCLFVTIRKRPGTVVRKRVPIR